MHSIPIWVFVLAAIATAAIAWLTFLLVRINRRLTAFTGALESHSTLRLRLALKKENIPVVWWDKTVEPWPVENLRHRNRSELTHAVLGVPERLRWGSAMRRYVGLLLVGIFGALASTVWLFDLAPSLVEWAAAWRQHLLFAALVLFGFLFFYALGQCFRKLLERERLRPGVPPEQSPEGR